MAVLRSAGSSRAASAMLLGLVIGIAGLMIGPVSFMVTLEEDAGLGLLFRLRGARPAPADTIVISIDKESSEQLNLPDNPDKWPRSLHARLVEKLASSGASVIAFDVHFIEPRSAVQDKVFAAAIRKAGNVILCQPLKLKEVRSGQRRRDTAENHNLVQVVQPLDLFVRSASATAPFTLPRIPFKVSQYWTFETSAGDVPTMPVVAFQLFTAPLYGDFVRLLERVDSKLSGKLPETVASKIVKGELAELISSIHALFEADPTLAGRMLEEVNRSGLPAREQENNRLLAALISMYAGQNSRYINYYGPPGSITTIPYYRALQPQVLDTDDRPVDLKGKVVFVGLSEVLLAERKDSFYTVFSQANGTFIGGVEILATAFANILNNRPLEPAGTRSYVAVILFWGMLLGVLCRMTRVWIAAAGALAASAIYFGENVYLFAVHDTWYPLATPLLIQAPLAFVGGILWSNRDATKELKNIKQAFGHYLPEEVVNRLSRDVAHLTTENRVVHGICMFTDAQQFTTLSENLEPHELSGFMNRYYAALFKPVKEHRGIVSGVTGDSMLALWVSPRAEEELKNKACDAALDIHRDLQSFRQKATDSVRIKTRVGLHCGNIMLGNIGALGHYEYTPMGDIVNTASRIEGLNKYLGTNILVSAEVVKELHGFLSRDLGVFRLKGKSKPISAFELMARRESADSIQLQICRMFNESMALFRDRRWDEAYEGFRQISSLNGGDGPARFYMKACERCRIDPPAEVWGCVVNMDDK